MKASLKKKVESIRNKIMNLLDDLEERKDELEERDDWEGKYEEEKEEIENLIEILQLASCDLLDFE